MADSNQDKPSALDAANFILELARADGIAIDPLTLQKILYYCQCWSLRDGECLFHDRIEAWKHGPVVRSVWLAHSGSEVIQHPSEPRHFALSPDQMDLIHGVWECLRGVHGTTLSRETHAPGSAWRKARANLPDTAPSDRALSADDMALDAAQIQEAVEHTLIQSWDEIERCAK